MYADSIRQVEQVSQKEDSGKQGLREQQAIKKTNPDTEGTDPGTDEGAWKKK